jgi:hypothetical protein
MQLFTVHNTDSNQYDSAGLCTHIVRCVYSDGYFGEYLLK